MRWDQIEGWFSHIDVQFVRNICGNIHNGVVVELGFFAGRSTSVMAPICKKNGSTYHAVDNCKGNNTTDVAAKAQRTRDIKQIFENNMRSLHLLDYINVHQMDSAEAAEIFDDESVDFCFVDASHVAEDVRRDIEAWWPKIKSGGVLGGHDYTFDSVRGVVDIFVQTHQLKLILSQDKQCWKVVK